MMRRDPSAERNRPQADAAADAATVVAGFDENQPGPHLRRHDTANVLPCGCELHPLYYLVNGVAFQQERPSSIRHYHSRYALLPLEAVTSYCAL